LCITNTCFFEGVQQQQKSQKIPRNALSDALLMSRFQDLAAGAATKKTGLGFLSIFLSWEANI